MIKSQTSFLVDKSQPCILHRMTASSTACSYVYILYLLTCEDAILTMVWLGPPIPTTLAGEWVNSLIVHGNIKCVAANNGQTIINVGADYTCHVMIIHFAPKYLRSIELFL